MSIKGVSDPKVSNDIELSDGVDNKCLQKLLNSKIIKYFSKDTSTKIALSTTLITVGSFFINILGYMHLMGFLSVFSIPIDSVGYSSNRGFVNFLINAFTFTGLSISVSFAYILIEFLVSQHTCRKAMYSNSNTTFFQKIIRLFGDVKKSFLIYLAALFFIELINILLLICSTSGKLILTSKTIEWVTALLVLTVIEIVTAAIILSISKIKKQQQIKEEKKAALATKAERDLEEIIKKYPYPKSHLLIS